MAVRGLRRWSAAAHLLGWWVRIPPWAWMFVSCECCMLSGRSLCDGPIPHLEEFQRVYHQVWPSATITLFTCNEKVDRGKKKRTKDKRLESVHLEDREADAPCTEKSCKKICYRRGLCELSHYHGSVVCSLNLGPTVRVFFYWSVGWLVSV